MNLTELGLSNNESRVFESLIKLGKSGANAISNESGVSNKKIYYVLQDLQVKGLVRLIPGKVKEYVPASPESLLDLVNKKKEELNNLEQEVKELKKKYESHEIVPVSIAQGKKNFYKIIRELPPAKKYNYAIKYSSEFNPESVRVVKQNIKGNIAVKVLTRYDKETESDIHKWLKIFKNQKQIPNEGVAMAIRDEAVFISLIKSNTMLLIRDKPFIKIIKELFDSYYAHAKEIQ
ncbi:MAG TPA: helix-turn-helix domain-containing protein [Candidatus Nanoarchaeia archaeon]|nr:helix-turn-helix domain-containing protein [Candidatus Nanoarchaeia archaeon]